MSQLAPALDVARINTELGTLVDHLMPARNPPSRFTVVDGSEVRGEICPLVHLSFVDRRVVQLRIKDDL